MVSLEDCLDEFDRTFDALRLIARRAVTQAYEAGYQAGAEAMRDSILRAAQTPLATSSIPRPANVIESDKSDNASASSGNMPNEFVSPEIASPLKASDTPSSRLRRGTVRRFLIGSALQDHRGMTIRSLQQAAEAAGLDLSSEAIGNELRRNEGRLYRREDSGLWFLVSEGGSAPEDGEEEAVGDPEKEHPTALVRQPNLTKEAHMEPP